MPEDKKISQTQVYIRLKQIISEETNGRLEPKDILADDELRGSKIGFNDNGVGGLAKPINKRFDRFGVRVSPAECRQAVTVRDLKDIVWEKVPKKHRKE
jgi:hypothetical protein